MKVFSALAVLLLIGESSAIQHRHHHNKRHAKGVHKQVRSKDNMYPPTKDGHEWHELDDFTERLHNQDSHQEDENSPHDPEVVDAPEDMKRVGNDHEALHNAKLSSDGYYDGFTHKDYEGKYAAEPSGGIRMHQKYGVSDDSYDDHFDNLHNTISSTHHAAESYRTNEVNSQEASDKWRGVKDKSIFD